MSRTRRNTAAFKRRGERFFREVGLRRAAVTWIRPSPLARRMFFDRPIAFDRTGEPLTPSEYGMLHSFRSYCRVAESVIGPFWISTVWIGVDIGFGFWDSPVIFETRVFDGRGPGDPPMHPELEAYVDAMVRARTEEEAEQGHAAVSVDIRQMLAKIQMAEEIHAEAMSG